MTADPSYAEFALRFAAVRELLGCPACHGALRLDGEGVVCAVCARKYVVVDGIPVLIPEQPSAN